MKKRILILIFILANYHSIAQLKFGLTAGIQFASVKLINYNTDSRIGFNAGAAALAPLAESIDIQLQLLVSGKGYKYYDNAYKNLMRPLYLELPVVFRFKFNTSNDTKIFLGAGGYYAFGLGGDKIYYNQGYRESSKINYGNEYTDDLETSDFGLVFQFGMAFRENYEGHFFYDMGLSKTIPNSTSNSYNRVFGFNLTWYL